MRRGGVVAAVTAAALLVAVVAVRDGTAADETDLAVGREEPSPVPSPSPDGAGAEPVVLAANGLPGARLGARPARTGASGLVTPGGCQLVWDPTGGMSGTGSEVSQPVGWETSAWVLDGEVVAVLLGTWDDTVRTPGGLETWLGPTLGSPIEAAQELPGARTVVERPFGTLGPAVRVVTVPQRGVEVVLSDLPPAGVAEPSASGDGRVTTIEVRRPSARSCAVADLGAVPGTQPQGWTVDVDGLGPLRLGAEAAVLAETDGVTADSWPGGGGVSPSCRGFALQGEVGSSGFARAVALDGVVTEVQVYDVGVATSFGLPADADADDVRARFPEVAARSGPMMGSGTVRVVVDGVDVELFLQRQVAWVPDLERPAEGGVPTVSGVTVRTPGSPVAPC